MKILLASLTLIAVACVQANDTQHPVKITALQRAVKIGGLKNGNRGARPKITGGNDASPKELPYQAGVDIDSYTFCGATIIHTDYLLTTATCAYGGRSFTIYLGSVNLRDDSERFTTNEAIIHESFDPSGFSYDIALLSLGLSLNFGDYVNKVDLPPPGNMFENVGATISGWGSSYNGGDLSGTLKIAFVNTISNDECRSVYGGLITDSHICTMPIDGSGSCFGDSGGPLTAQYSVDCCTIGTAVVGISAFFDNHGCGHGPDGYTRVSTFLDWIISHLR